MFYPRRNTLKTPTRRNFKINVFGGFSSGIAENLVNLSQSKCCYNVTAKDGELTQSFGSLSAQIMGSGESGYVLPQPKYPVRGVWYYRRFDHDSGVRDDRLIVLTIFNELYSLAIDKKASEYVLLKSSVASVYTAECYRIGDEDVMLISTDVGFYMINDTTVTEIENAPPIKSLCIHFERAFATVHGEGISLWFSKSLDPTDWSISAESGGYIDFADQGGKLTKVVSFMGYLYVFREYAIERISAYAEQTEFNAKKVYTSSDKIFENTVAVCGDRIIFLTESGLFYFDGASVSPLSRSINQDIGIYREKAVGEYYRGVYFLSCYMGALDREETGYRKERYIHNNCIFLYDLSTGKSEIMMDYDVKGFCVAQTKDNSELFFYLQEELQSTTKIAVLHENCNVRLGFTGHAYWRSGMTDLGYPEKKKLLRSISVSSDKPITVGVILDDKRIEKSNVKGVGVKISINRPFSKIGFYFKCETDTFRISNPVITVDMR